MTWLSWLDWINFNLFYVSLLNKSMNLLKTKNPKNPTLKLSTPYFWAYYLAINHTLSLILYNMTIWSLAHSAFCLYIQYTEKVFNIFIINRVINLQVWQQLQHVSHICFYLNCESCYVLVKNQQQSKRICILMRESWSICYVCSVVGQKNWQASKNVESMVNSALIIVTGLPLQRVVWK